MRRCPAGKGKSIKSRVEWETRLALSVDYSPGSLASDRVAARVGVCLVRSNVLGILGSNSDKPAGDWNMVKAMTRWFNMTLLDSVQSL